MKTLSVENSNRLNGSASRRAVIQKKVNTFDLEGSGFGLVRRQEMNGKRKEIWCDGERIVLVEGGEQREISLSESLSEWQVQVTGDLDVTIAPDGEFKWLELLRSHLIVRLTKTERAAVELCAARFEDGDVDAYVRTGLLSQVESDLDEVKWELRKLT